MSARFYFNYLVENYPAQWRTARFDLLPKDLDGNLYSNWKEVYDNFLAYLETKRVPAQVPRFQEAPEDIFNTIFLMTPMEEIPTLVEKYCKHDPERCSSNRSLWKLLWKRDIGNKLPEDVQTYTSALGETIKEKYLNFVTVINKETHVERKFYQGIRYGAINLLHKLIETEVNIFNTLLVSEAFRFAAMYNQLEIIKYLVSLGPQKSEPWMFTEALLYASREGHLEIVKYLVSIGADISANNYRALILAAENRHLQLVNYFVSLGADITAIDRTNVLLYLAQISDFKFLNDLVSLGADINVIPIETRRLLGI